MAPTRIRREPTDVELLLGPAAGLGAFYRRYERPVLGYFLRRTGRADLAADLTAEVFARVIESRGRFDPDRGEPRSWLFAIARNVLTRSYDRGRVEDATRQALEFEPLVLEDDLLDAIESAADELVADALAVLPPEQADAIRGRVLDERSYDDLADQLGCSASVVRQRVSRGLRSLRTRMEDAR
jgi:RNA polymerase sigma factor (sigma-70 family)